MNLNSDKVSRNEFKILKIQLWTRTEELKIKENKYKKNIEGWLEKKSEKVVKIEIHFI